jgi:hypothetical protein
VATQPTLLRDLLARRRAHRDVEEEVAKAFGKSHNEFWSTIDTVLVQYFRDNEIESGLIDISVC